MTAADPLRQLARFADLLAVAPHNLVARGDRPNTRALHIDEAVAVGDILSPVPGTSWMDLGTGGGLPGVALAVTHPLVHWTLVDSVAKKIGAVRGFVADLGLTNVSVVQGRAEDLARLAEHRGRYDGLVARAVARLPVLLELARGFLRPGAVLAAIKGPSAQLEVDEAQPARRALGYETPRLVPITSQRPTLLVLMTAAGPPPARFPRPDGVPSQRPLVAGRVP